MGSVVKRVTTVLSASAKSGFFSNLFMIANPYLALAVNFVGSFIVSAVLSKAFAKKPKANFGQQLQARTEMVKQPIIPRDTVYGLTKKSGGILFMESSNNNQDLHIIVEVASHEIQAIDKVYFGEDELTLASAGTDTNGLTQYKVTAPSKYASESKFTAKTRTLIVSEYTQVTYNVALPFGGSQLENGYGVAKGITSVTLLSDSVFTVTTADTININGESYGVSSGGTASGSALRFTLAVTLSE